ncbi:MAG: glycine--tRNA ligase subunit beta, partial [Terriglobia bacterium]
MADLLLEIGVEELPSGAVEMGVRQIEERAVSLLRAARLTHGDVKVLGTPRRLTMVVDRVADHQDEAVSEVKGPPKKAAFVDDKPGPAAVGFAKSQGVDVDDLTTRDVNGGEYLFAVRRDRGRPATALLPDLLSQLVSSISFPRSMRWDRSGVRFARPVRWLLALSDDKPIPFSFGTVESGTRTWGHRLLRPESFEVKAVGDYFKVMADGKIIPDHAERRSADGAGGAARE